MPRRLTAVLTALTLVCITACGGHDHDHDHGDTHNAFGEVSKAICVLKPTDSTELKDVAGTITFTMTKSGVLVEAEVTGLTPNSKHGLHIHQWGDLSANDGSATGGHYDPMGIEAHGLPSVHSHGDIVHAMVVGHAGALGNLETDDQGNASYTMTYENLSLKAGNALLGRSVIIRLNEDTGEQPDGNAGPAVAQGVIGIANPE
ncbi:MAG: superoxide dismutase family protein [Planctomycetota bacterium]